MSKYYWSNNTLQRKLDELKLQERKVTGKKLDIILEDIRILQMQIEEPLFTYDKPPLLDCYEELKETYNRINFLWQHFKDFKSIIDKSLLIPQDMKNVSYSPDDILELTNSFYQSLNKFFYRNFLKIYQSRKNHIVFNLNDIECIQGETIFLKSTRESYIRVGKANNIDDILTTIHEYGHATSFQINPTSPHKYLNVFSELESLFFELLGYDYLTKTLNSSDPLILKITNHNIYDSKADDISEYLDLINLEKITEPFDSNKKIKFYAQEQLDMNDIILEQLIQTESFFPEIYLTSYMYAIELYMLYQKDPDLALYYLQKIIMMRGMSEKQYYYNIKQLGIFPNEHLEEFQESLKRDLINSNISFTHLKFTK